MKRCLYIFALAFATVLFAAEPSELVAVRRALGDGLWDVAASVSSKVAIESKDVKVRTKARLIELEALAGAGRVAEILSRLKDISDSDDEGFRYWRAWAKFETGNIDEARHLLAGTFESRVYQILTLRLSARVSVCGKDKAAAISFFEKADAALVGDLSARAENAIEWARALEAFDDVSGARALLARDEIISVQGISGDSARLLSAQLALRAGETANGRSILEALVARGEKTEEQVYVSAACALSDIFFAAGSIKEARSVASNAVMRATRPALVRRAGFTMGFVLLADAATREEGYNMISSLVRKYPGEAESGKAQLRLADRLLAVGDAAAAVREYEVLLQAYPEHALDAHVLEGRGLAFSRLGRRAEAVGMLARAAQVTTNNAVRARCIFEQGDVLVADGRYKEAAAAYGSVGTGDLQLEARFRQADALRQANQTSDALEIFRSIVNGGGEHFVEATLRVAHLEASRGHLEQAIADYGSLLVEKPVREPKPEQKVRALSGRGRALYRAYRFREAAVDFSAVAKLQPARSNEMGFLSALCLYGDGRDREAYASARALLSSVADSLLKCDLQFWIARYEAERHEWASAISGFESCSTNSYASITRRIDSIVRASRCAASLSDFPKVVELTGRIASQTVTGEAAILLAEALVLQGEALKELARFDEAVLVFEKAGRVTDSEVLRRRAEVSRADCLFAMGADDAKCYQSALEAYRMLLQGDKLSASARLELSFKVGRTCEKLRRHEEAVEEYYTHVVLAYWNGVRSDGEESEPKVLFDGAARAFFARAAFILADYYESRGELRQAARMLKYLVAARVPSAEEAERRIGRLKERGGF